ncbi:MutS protein msh5 [Mortierella sp. GBA39]|nr:MutS protein msh5 [Mortierella sp. GBA39]
MPEPQPPSQDHRHNDPTPGGQPTSTAAYSAARDSASARLTARSIAATWSSSPVRQVQPQAQSHMSTRSRDRGTSQSQSQGRGRGRRGRGQSSTRESNQSSTTQSRTAATGTAPSDVYSVEHGPAPLAGDGLSSSVPSSPAPSFSSGYPPLQTEFLDPRFVQDVRADDNAPECSSAFGYDREASSGPSRGLELQGDPVGTDSQWTDPDSSDSHLLRQSFSSLTLGNEIILAINMRGKTLGGAYYDGTASKLFVMQDTPDCNAVDMVETIKDQVRPMLILTSTRLEEYVTDALKWNEDGSENKLEIRPGGEFSYQLAKTKLISIVMQFKQSEQASTASVTPGSSHAFHGSADIDESAQRDAQIQLLNLIDLESNESVGCAGAVISFLSRNGIAHRSTRDGRSTMAVSVAAFTLDSFMYINKNTLSSLQIFEDESHPSMHSSIRGRKEGLSLFGLLNQTKTSQGRHLLKQWLLRPSLNMATIHQRHQTVECFVQTENQPTVNQLAGALLHMKNIPKVLQTMSRKATINDWRAILEFVYYCVKISNISQEIFVGVSPVIQEIQRYFAVEELMNMGTNINGVLDFDESVIEGRCVVKRNVDEELDSMRKNYHGLDVFLSEIAKEISVTIPSDFTSIINVIYFPQLGYLITVPRNPEWKSEEDYELEGLTVQFSTETTVYYKNATMRELDEHLGDIHGLIVDREIDILQALQERIIENSQFLVTCSDHCAELDVLVSLARVARLHNYRRPTMVEGTILKIMNGRHPLQEMVVDSFVTNSTQIGGMDQNNASAPTVVTGANTDSRSSETGDARVENRVTILTGPNSSGKSVYLKQVALIAFMAHVGSFVPADSAVVGITDKILTRMQTRETVSSIQSAFMTDLQQVALATRMSTARSLVLLDEFGKGTTSTDGAGLFCGVIEHFARLNEEDRPRVLATTHFHELFENDLMDLSLPISLYTMEVYQQPDCMEATFLFRVVPGKTPSSLGPACAAMASMPTHIVKRGVYFSQLFRRYENVVPHLTAHEKEMEGLYERLIEMLLRMDLEKEQALDFWDRYKGMATTAGDESGSLQTRSRSVKAEKGSGTAAVSTKTPSGVDGGSNSSGGAGSSSLGKRRYDDGSALEEGESEEIAAASEATGATKTDPDNAMRDALHGLLELAAEIGRKEREE